MACHEGLISSLALVAVLGLDIDPRDLWVVKENAEGKKKNKNQITLGFHKNLLKLFVPSSSRGTTAVVA